MPGYIAPSCLPGVDHGRRVSASIAPVALTMIRSTTTVPAFRSTAAHCGRTRCLTLGPPRSLQSHCNARARTVPAAAPASPSSSSSPLTPDPQRARDAILAATGLAHNTSAYNALESSSKYFHTALPLAGQYAVLEGLHQHLSAAALGQEQLALCLLLVSGAMRTSEDTPIVLDYSSSEVVDSTDADSASDSAADSPANPLAGCSIGAAAVRRAKVMQKHVGHGEKDILNDPDMIRNYEKKLQLLGPDAVWEQSQKAIHLHYHGMGDVRRADGAKRECNGIFFQLLNKAEQAHKQQQLPPLWPASEPPPELRDYQQAAVNALMQSGGNMLLVAPCNSGKTWIAAEAASYNPLNIQNWGQALQQNSIVVATAQSFLNVLEKRPEALQELDLLVLDEVHGARGDSPLQKILDVYAMQAEGPACQQLPRLLGMTASPAAEETEEATRQGIQRLQQLMGASIHVIPEEILVESKVIGSPTCRELSAPNRPSDHEAWWHLLTALMKAGATIHTAAAAAAEGAQDTPLAEVYSQLRDATFALRTCAAEDFDAIMLAKHKHGSEVKQVLQQVHECIHTSIKHVRSAVNQDSRVTGAAAVEVPLELKRCLHLCQGLRQQVASSLQGMRSALLLLEDAGAAAATRHMGWVLYTALCAVTLDEQKLLLTQLTTTDHSSSSSSSSECEGLGSTAATPGGLMGSAGTASDGSEGAAAACWQLPAVELAKQHLRACGLAEPGPVVQAYQQDSNGFPRLHLLIKVLKEYAKNTQDFHCIVFVRHRVVVPWLAEELRAALQPDILDEVLELVGTTTSGKDTSSLLGVKAPGSHGTSKAEQALVLERFKDAGRRVLVATSAAEEGLDVPSCSLVVRYNPATSGQQLIQSSGRARDLDSSYVTLLDQDKDWGSSMALGAREHHQNSIVEACNMNEVLEQMRSAEAENPHP